jgi:hypothetical protein
MTQFLIDYKWVILITCETTTWLATLYMLYARYWLKPKIQFYISGVIAIVTGYFPHIFIGVLDFIETQRLDSFTFVIILLFIFAFTYRKKVVTKVDLGIQRWVNKQRQISN